MSAHIFDGFFFGIYPYIALSVLILGSILRYDCAPYSWRSGSSQLLRRRQLIAGSVLFHAGVLVVFIGHLVGLLTPIRVFEFIDISHGAKQIMAIVVGGVAGALAFLGATLLLHRRLFDPRIRRTSSFGDIAILVLLWLQLALGLGTIPVSAQHLDGGEMLRFMAWAQGIFTFRTDAWTLVQDAHWVFKAHLILGLTIFLVFPFTRLVHMLSAPLRYLWRRGWQIVRTRHALG
ncbi:MAG: respiratory nitrate reductase subunit gamma [Rhodothalassiaceae bacterium]|nr:MAG: respiratory nitrate reductase subunit gamma [Rhodothalassiaceae bacterium]